MRISTHRKPPPGPKRRTRRPWNASAVPRYLQDRDDLAAIYDQPANIPFVARRGDKLFNFWKDAEHPRGLWRTTTLESYRTDNPDWEILLDLDALAEAEGEDWIWGAP